MNSEYKKYHKSKRAKLDRAARNRVRQLIKKKRGAKALNGKEIDHIDGNPRNNSPGNVRVISRHRNRVKQ